MVIGDDVSYKPTEIYAPTIVMLMNYAGIVAIRFMHILKYMSGAMIS